MYDVVVIGAGPGGYLAAVRAARYGLKTACIDKGAAAGGTCLNVGCIPSKALLHATETYDYFKNIGPDLGLKSEKIQIDFQQMMKRKTAVVKGLTDSIAGLFKQHGVEWIQGTAHFKTPQQLTVSTQTGEVAVEGKSIIIATGSEAIPLPFLPFDGKKVISSTEVLSLAEIPQRMTVVGGGVIGVELASVYQRLGTEVSIVEMLDHICPALDRQVSKGLLQTLKKQGIVLHFSTKVLKGKVRDSGPVLTVSNQEGEFEIQSDIALVAVGRRPFIGGLGLDGIGIVPNSRGFISVDSWFRTSIPHIYAIGDVIEGAMLAHRASDEGIAVVDLIEGKKPLVDYMAVPNVVYTHPEAAAVGMTEEEASQAGLDLLKGVAFFRANARARCSDDIEGFVKIIGEKSTGRIVGLHILGPHASEMIGEGVIAIKKRLLLSEIAMASHAHPSLSESIKDAAMHALESSKGNM